jgi:hypothetical protein
MSTKLLWAILVSAALVAPGAALANAGGEPNPNAFPPSNGQGRKSVCPPPGSVIREFAQEPGVAGPNPFFGQPVGNAVEQSCTPN